ncbi:hypothetical protein [Propionivibrio sp.]|uniref:hypothetical protein n=1 Tax=Propionivibrio sp. TaxID=2212460 RepID=UPI003BF2404F
MTKNQVSAILLTFRGLGTLALALIDWLTARVNASERHYLIPAKVACEYWLAIRAAWQGQRKQPSLLECTHWNRKACGPSPGGFVRRIV